MDGYLLNRAGVCGVSTKPRRGSMCCGGLHQTRGGSQPSVDQFVAELVLLVVVAARVAGYATHPGRAAALVRLAVASIAMGGQSAAALRLHAATTYLTGALTGALHDVVTG